MKNNKLCKFSALVLAAAMVLAMIPVSALAGFSGWFSTWADAEEVSVETQATTGTITQPFESGTEGSTNFRIPAIVTLNDGTIVAAADARWSSASDSGGIDTLVAVSKDSGESWTHVWANYLGNNKNTKAQDSNYGTFIDPSLATDGDTVYMLVDLFPRGHHNGNVGLDGDAFVDDGHMRLSQGDAGNTEASYTYYLGDFNYMDYAQIFDSTTGYTVDGYTVDRWFNLYYNGVAAGNLFYDSAAYQAYPISYLYLTKSTDGGNTWSAPTLIDLKENGEIFYGTCPGGGYVTSTGRIIFPCYKANTIGWDYLCTSVIYSDDCGETWTRSANIGTVGYKTDKSTSESTLSEVTIDGKSYLYLFSRSNNSSVKQYFVSEDDGTTWEFGGSLTGDVGTVSYGTASALGSITYSKLIDGCPAIIFSAPASTSHSSGVIYVGLVQSDGTINFKYKTTVTSDDDYFKYSDLAELEDGRVALLYESAWTTKSAAAEITFEVFDIAELCEDKGKVTVEDKDSTSGITVAAPGLTSVKVENVNATYSNETVGFALNKAVTGVVAYDITPATASGDYQDNATIKIPVDTSWNTERVGAFTVVDSKIEDLGKVTVEDGYATINAKHFSVYGLYALAEGETFEEVVIEANETIDLKVGETSSTYTVDGTYNAVASDTKPGIANTTLTSAQAEDGTTATPVTSVKSGSAYYIKNSDNEYLKLSGTTVTWTSNAAEATQWTCTEQTQAGGPGGSKTTYRLSSGSYYLNYQSNSSLLVTTSVQSATSWTVSNGSFSYKSGYGNNTTYTLGQAYTLTTTYKAVTNITFTGVAPGTTYVTVGETTYQINVSKGAHTVYVQPGKSITLDTKYGTEIEVKPANESIAKATVSSGAITIEGIVEGETTMETELYKITIKVANVVTDITTENSPFVGGTTNVYYSDTTKFPVSHGRPITKITITTNLAGGYDVDLSSAFAGQEVEWSVGNESIATVDVNGKITPVAAGETTLMATVSGITYQIPLVVHEGPEESTEYIFHVYIGAIVNCKVYYSYNFGELISAEVGDVFYGAVVAKGQSAFAFFGAPNEGYALTGMLSQTSENNKTGEFYKLYDDNGVVTDTTKTGYFASVFNNYFDSSREEVNKMLTSAVSAGCDGAQGYTSYYKEDKGSVNISFSPCAIIGFYAQKLPTVTKEVEGVYASDGTEKSGNLVEIGDTVKFTITTTRYATIADYGTITYSDENLVESLNVTGLTNPDMGTSTEQAETYTCTVSLKLTTDNFASVVKNGKIQNTVDLTYTYETDFRNNGTMTSKATAAANVTVSVPTYIVDFGLPVTVNIKGTLTSMGWSVESVSGASYKNDGTITYTPNSVLTEEVYIPVNVKASATTNGNQTIEYGVRLIPASNVLYEENFLTAPTVDESKPNWKLAGNTTHNTRQAAETLAEYTNVYGYDPAYASITQANGVYQATGLTTQTMTAALTTTFTGTGFDLIGNCGYDTGRVMLVLKNQATNKRYVSIVDTRYGTVNDDPLYQVPLAHREVPQGTYTVSIYASAAAAVEAASTSNAVSTYSVNRTSASSSDAFERYLKENNITDVEYIVMDDVLTASAQSVSAISTYATTVATVARPLGDYVEIDAFRVYYDTTEEANNPNTTSYNADEQNVQYVNILDVVENKIIAWTETDGSYSGEVTDYEANGGPENEIYLTGTSGSAQSGQAVTFQIADANSIQVSLRSVDGNEVKVGNHTIKSSTEMYYTIQSTDENGTFTIVNNGTGILGIGNVKIPGGMDEASILTASELDPEVVSYSIRMALAVEPDQPVEDEPEQPVTFVPEKINVSSRSVNVLGRKLVTVSVTASADVAYITVNGQKVNAWNNGLSWIYQPSTLRFTFTDLLKRGESKTYEIVAYNADGVASAVYTVQG